jgi:carbon monoxide dehydrogenase subunit G
MHLERRTEVAKPIEEAFDFLANAENEPKFNPWAHSVHKVTEGPVREGTVFHGSFERVGEVDEDLSVYERPNRVAYHSDGGAVEGIMTFELTPRPQGGTRVRVLMDARPRGSMKVMGIVMPLMMKPHLRDVVKGIERELAKV